ncbi:protein kinase domain-containing protein [Colletotrichum chrysophilum]|uniref:Protein kinase domain-containing protein n=1 Tax=Colletotrichum chrysophilum TaxID=1836956 RepID=A0AAD9E8U9_9PEZI|nr:protein kinase domain-containing protein [Colletotrichum chrysophilum]
MPDSFLHAFYETQWICLAPFLDFSSENLQVSNLEPAAILPFVELGPEQESSVVRGGFGSVWKVVIHPAHHDFHHTTKKNTYFAVKQLRGLDSSAYKAELDALQKIHHFEHPNIVNALFSYTHMDSHYFVFSWADCNLRQYWNRHSDCSHRSGKEVARWTLQQSVGLASGIESLHNTGPNYGRHGDLKPENILWFSDSDERGNMLGTLKISDFGLAKFHGEQTQARYAVDAHNCGTAIYSPPEVQQTRRVSQSMDIWSLGCVFLESLTWLASGREGLQALSTSRASTSTGAVQNRFKDAYFEISDDAEQVPGSAQLKAGVAKFIDELRTFPQSSYSFDDVLSFVQHRMLEPSPDGRAGASEVVSILTSLLARYESTMLNEGGSGIDSIVHVEDEKWDEYGVDDALQHNLLADGVELLHTVEISSDLSSKSLSQQVWDAQDISREELSASIAPPRPSPSPESLSVLPDVDAWNNTFDSGYYSIPFHAPEQSGPVEPPAPSSGPKRRPESPLARPAARIKRKKGITDLSTTQASTTIPPSHSTSEDLNNSSLFPCPFYHHDRAKYGARPWRCMGPGWNISRLKEHLYRVHSLPEHACQTCLAEFKTDSELAGHKKEAVCSKLSDTASGKIGKVKEGKIRQRRLKVPNHEKWKAIYEILFDCIPFPLTAPSSDAQSTQPTQTTEGPETVRGLEQYLQNMKRLGGSEASLERLQGFLDIIQEYREQHHAKDSTKVFQDPFPALNTNDLNIANVSVPRLSGNETEQLTDVSMEGVIADSQLFCEASGDWCFPDGLKSTFEVTDEYMSEAFPCESPGDLLGDISTAAEGCLYVPGHWT